MSLQHVFGFVSELIFPVVSDDILADFDLLNAVVVAISAAIAAGKILFQYMSSASFCCWSCIEKLFRWSLTTVESLVGVSLGKASMCFVDLLPSDSLLVIVSLVRNE